MKLGDQVQSLFRDNPYRYLLGTAWHYAAGSRGKYLLVYTMFTVVNALVSLQPIIFGLFIDYLQRSGGDLRRAALYYGGAYMAIILGSWVFQWPARLMERQLAFELSRRQLLETYRRVVALPLRWHAKHHSGDTINRTRKAYEALRNFFDNGFIYFQTLLRIAIALVALLWFSPLFGVIASSLGILMVGAVLLFDEPIIRATKETNERENRLMARLNDSLGNIVTVLTLRLGGRTAENIDERAGEVWPPFLRRTRLNEQKWFVVAVLIGFMYASIVVGYVYQNYVPGEVLLVGGLVTLIGYVNQFSNMFNQLTGQYNQIIAFRSDLAAIDPIVEAYREVAVPQAAPALVDWGRLDVRGLDFTYDPTRRAGGLKQVNLSLQRGHRVALIGPSGSGKTTILYTLRGLYPADRAEFLVDGQPIEGAQLYRQTTLIPQSPEIFEDTLLTNITMGLPQSEEAINRAIEVSALRTVIEKTEGGLQAYLAEGGANLSGGQRQRLSIARGLLAAADSSLLCLDEPTSSLDPQTELKVYKRLFAAFPDKTIVSSLHRLHLLRLFDYIYYLEDGRVLEQGTFSDLLASGERFQRLWHEQAGTVDRSPFEGKGAGARVATVLKKPVDVVGEPAPGEQPPVLIDPTVPGPEGVEPPG